MKKFLVGVSCFTTSTNLQLVITGGRDCFIRTWNPFVSTRATAKLRGHHTEILCLLVQEEGNVLLSMDNERYIKVWDLKEQCCLQTFLGLHSITKKYCPTSYYYNPETRQLFIADIKIYSMEIFPLLNGEFTDGVSHSKEVSVVLYNNLLQVIVTCGYDSVIIVWDPYAGRRQKVIRNAHMKTKHGETLPVEITAAAWNHSQKLLITGATDGTLKIWNFNAGVCYRNMSIQDGCEVCAIVWLKYRILVTGENRVVTEFADGDDASYTSYKNWISRHKDDVLCAVVHQPQTLVTGSYSGEIVFWRLETGQTFGMYNVRDPRRRIQLQYQVENSRSKVNNQMKKNTSSKLQWHSEHNDASKARATVESCEFDLPEYTEKIPIHCMLFLLTRRIEPNTGTLLVSLQNGNIQLWSHHAGGGYLRSFKAKHAPPDYVISMCTDSKNEFLFTGHMSGYLKIWHIINYGQHEEDQVHVCKPLIRLKFPFLLKDFIPGRAKRANKGEGPWLLSSLRCHLKAVTGIVYLEANEIVITSSSDKSVRFWTLGGRYLGTLGTFKPWTNIIPNVPIDPKRETVLPADLQRTASFTTRKVLMNGMVERRSKNKNEEEVQIETVDIDQDDYEKFVENYFKLPKSQTKYRPVKIEDRHVQIAPYSQLNLYEFAEVKRIHTPELLKQIRAQNESVAAEKPKQQIAFKLH